MLNAKNKDSRQASTSDVAGVEKQKTGWGLEGHPYPSSETAYIQTRWDLCVGCGLCEIACSMFHYGVINRDLSRIRIYRFFTPLTKAVQNVCVQCQEEERKCEKVCPVEPPVITYDKEKRHMKVDTDRCLGHKCGKCTEVCPVPFFYPPTHDFSIICDLCERDGERKPQCIEVCPAYALEFRDQKFPSYMERISPEEKAESLSKRLYPLPKDAVGLGWKKWLK